MRARWPAIASHTMVVPESYSYCISLTPSPEVEVEL